MFPLLTGRLRLMTSDNDPSNSEFLSTIVSPVSVVPVVPHHDGVEPMAVEMLPDPESDHPVAQPVEAVERVASVDVIRGFALLGILAMNIVSFAWPGSVYEIPIMAEGAGPLDTFLWGFNHLIFDTKMMTLFSMLFGAGLVIQSNRAESRGTSLTRVYYRRIFWLLVIGIIHAVFIWEGDVLVIYALCGLLLYPFRAWKPRTLIVAGIAGNLMIVVMLLGFRFIGIPYMQSTFDEVATQLDAKQEPTWWRRSVHDAWKEMSKQELPKREDFLKEIARYRGPYLGLVTQRATSLVWMPIGLLMIYWWMIGGRMLIGMGMMKMGVFSASLAPSTYQQMIRWGYGIGLPYMLFDAVHEATNGFFLGRRLWYMLDGWPLITILGSLPVVIGHIGLVMRMVQTGTFPWLTRRLAAVGRMALSNYLATSLFCTTLFYGYGLDFFATIHRPLLWGIVLAIWMTQLLLSPLWLEHFRFGPAEWLWRSLTYRKLQPMRARAEPGYA